MNETDNNTPPEKGDTGLAAFTPLTGLAQRLSDLDAELKPLCEAEDRGVSQKARKLRKDLRAFEPGVTFIGQVKAGKTTLVNALIGWPGLLPADVNPWTSVVTAVHLSPPSRRKTRRAAFRFFSNAEWDTLIRNGGRVGEIASRAGAESELAKVRAQLEEMREKSRRRLGRRFQMLLGQEHSYDSVDSDLIKRYVCMGDNFWEDAGGNASDGQFADITKTAELWFENPDVPMGLCIQDTPGVNDTFMIREQITINALRGSRLCVMVLSAQQALSTVDLGLIRLISNLKSRDIIIFVNRIDELSDPGRQVPEIRASITETLARFDGPKNVELIFGSAFWAENAAADTLDDLGTASGEALMNWAEAQVDRIAPDAPPREVIWTLSGLPELGRAISDRVQSGVATQLLAHMETELENLRASSITLDRMQQPSPGEELAFAMPAGELMRRLDEIHARSMTSLNMRLDAACEVFDQRAEKARSAFLSRATGALVSHLNTYGENEVWTYDPNGLRMLLRTAYKVFGSAAQKAAADEAAAVVATVSGLLQEAVTRADAIAPFAAPPIPQADAPVTLAQTIALDLKGNWWGRFWRRRRGYEAFAEDFARMIHEETAPMSDTLRSGCVVPYCDTVRNTVSDLIEDQREMVRGMLRASACLSDGGPQHVAPRRLAPNARKAV